MNIFSFFLFFKKRCFSVFPCKLQRQNYFLRFKQENCSIRLTPDLIRFRVWVKIDPFHNFNHIIKPFLAERPQGVRWQTKNCGVIGAQGLCKTYFNLIIFIHMCMNKPYDCFFYFLFFKYLKVIVKTVHSISPIWERDARKHQVTSGSLLGTSSEYVKGWCNCYTHKYIEGGGLFHWCLSEFSSHGPAPELSSGPFAHSAETRPPPNYIDQVGCTVRLCTTAYYNMVVCL